MSDRIINTSGKDRWGTPPEVIEWVIRNVGIIGLDAAADEETAICHRYLTDAFIDPWPVVGVAFCNPPYSRRAGGLAAWCELMVAARALDEAAAIIREHMQ